MNCREVEQEGLIERYLAGRLSNTERAAFEDHAAGCTACSHALELGRAIRRGFALEESSGIKPIARKRPRILVPLLAAAALAALFLAYQGVTRGGADARLVALGTLDASDIPPYVPAPLRAQPPDSSDALFERGMSSYQSGDYAGAVPDLERAWNLGADSPLYAFYLGAALLASERPEEATPHLAEAAAAPEFADDARWLLAKAHLQQGEIEGAVRILHEIVRRNGPRSADAEGLLSAIGQPSGSAPMTPD